VSNRTQLPGWLRRASLVMLAFVATSCGDDNPSNPPTTGSIQVTAATAGDEIDADGYAVAIDDFAGRPIAVDGTETFTNLSAGAHAVTLSGVAANCMVAGDNPRTVTVTAGSTASTTFNVTCSATAGELAVTTVSTGDDIDADGYTVSVDSGAAQDIDANGTLTVTGLDAGDHTVELGDFAANCLVAGDNPRTVAVTAGGTATTQFDIECTAIAPDTGDLKVVNVTTGNGLDDSYTVTVDGGAPQALVANDSLAVADLNVGDYAVELGDVAANCIVAGENPRTVTVPSGAEVRTQFDVTCQSGSLGVTTSTWGLGQDGDGYEVVIDGGAPLSIGTNETQSIPLSVGDHTIELQSIAANCSVQSGTNPRTETIVDGAETASLFDVFCFQTLQNAIVFGTDRDGNREVYVRPQGGTPLTNMTSNGALDANPSVSSDGQAVVFDSNRDGTGTEIWRMDASGFTKLTPSGTEFDPSYTGAGDKQIAFVRVVSGDQQIWVMGNGGVVRNVVAAAAGFDNFHPAYSPDGNWILFASDRDGDNEIYVVRLSDLQQFRLTNNVGTDAKPAWWHDGSRILWASDRTADFEVWAADFDNVTPGLSNFENLSGDAAQADFMPAMRPDGGKVMFVRGGAGTEDIWTMDQDGTNKAALTDSNTGSRELNPTFSPWVP